MKRVLLTSVMMTGVAAQDVAGNCLKLSTAKLKDVIITSTEMVAAGEDKSWAQWPPQAHGIHCKVKGKINERKGIDGKTYAIGFELRMPSTWNGKFYFQGGGGTDGKLLPATGLSRGSNDVNALTRGYAVVSTDGGHIDEQGVKHGGYLFGYDPQARADYGYNAVVQTTYVAKYLVANVYGKQPTRSYFSGCSNGGRQALKAVMTIPEEFDGIIAQAPAMQLSAAPLEAMRWAQLYSKFAPMGKDGKPDLGSAFSNDELALVAKGILDKCDALDGVKDGMVYNTKACKFDATALSCSSGQNSACLPHYKAVALNEAYSGKWPKAGKVVYASWPTDPGLIGPGWRFWRLGAPGSTPNNSATLNLVPGSVTYSFIVPPKPVDDLQTYARTVDFEAEHKLTAATNGTFKQSMRDTTDSRDSNIDKFVNKGGKIIMAHGMSDGIFSANDSIDLMNNWTKRYGNKTGDIARLFLQPGMGHCSGGPSADEFDLLTSLENWVEKKQAPESIVAKARAQPTVTFVGRTRPMCAYPKYAHYKGNGSIEAATNFECRN